MTSWKRDPRFAEYVALFNRREFFRAHEVLEALWLEYRGEDRPFLQGLIQLAVALEHAARENPRGALKVLHSAGRRLESYGETYAGIKVGSLLKSIEAFLAGERKTPPRLQPFRESEPHNHGAGM